MQLVFYKTCMPPSFLPFLPSHSFIHPFSLFDVAHFHLFRRPGSVSLCLWRDEFRRSSAILITAGLSLNETLLTLPVFIDIFCFLYNRCGSTPCLHFLPGEGYSLNLGQCHAFHCSLIPNDSSVLKAADVLLMCLC